MKKKFCDAAGLPKEPVSSELKNLQFEVYTVKLYKVNNCWQPKRKCIYTTDSLREAIEKHHDLDLPQDRYTYNGIDVFDENGKKIHITFPSERALWLLREYLK